MSTIPLRPIDPASIAPGGPLHKVHAQATELEGVFLNTLVSEMFSSLKGSEEFGGGFAEDTWRSMQSEQLAGRMAEAGGIGLADQLMGDLLALQEASQAQNTSPAGAYYKGV